MAAPRNVVLKDSAISRALAYSLKRWAALSRHRDDGAVPTDNTGREIDPTKSSSMQNLALRWIATQRKSLVAQIDL